VPAFLLSFGLLLLTGLQTTANQATVTMVMLAPFVMKTRILSSAASTTASKDVWALFSNVCTLLEGERVLLMKRDPNTNEPHFSLTHKYRRSLDFLKE